MRTIQKLLLCFFAFWLASSPLLAGPVDKAREAWSAGDYKKAVKLAGKAAKKAKDPSEKAEALVIQGAAAYKIGKKGGGKFKKALQLDPDVSLPSGAESDKKIAKVFAKAQKKAGSKVSSGGGSTSSDTLTKSASRADTSPGNIKNYLPFGANSFMQGKTLTAVALGGMQVGGLFLWMNRMDAAAAADKDAKAVIADAEANDATQTEEFLQFLDDNDAFVKKANSEASLALLLVAGGYALSVIDSLFDPMGTATASLDVGPKKEAYANLGSSFEERKIDSSWKFDLQVLPAKEPGLMFTMKQSF